MKKYFVSALVVLFVVAIYANFVVAENVAYAPVSSKSHPGGMTITGTTTVRYGSQRFDSSTGGTIASSNASLTTQTRIYYPAGINPSNSVSNTTTSYGTVHSAIATLPDYSWVAQAGDTTHTVVYNGLSDFVQTSVNTSGEY